MLLRHVSRKSSTFAAYRNNTALRQLATVAQAIPERATFTIRVRFATGSSRADFDYRTDPSFMALHSGLERMCRVKQFSRQLL